MHDQLAIKQMLFKTHFCEIEIAIVSKIGESPSSREAAQGLVYGNPLIATILDQSVIDAETVVREIDHAIAIECGSVPARAKMQAVVVMARRPAND
jgi:hypothetical protein